MLLSKDLLKRRGVMIDLLMHWYLSLTNPDYQKLSESQQPKVPVLLYEYNEQPLWLGKLIAGRKTLFASYESPIKFKFKDQVQIFYDNQSFLGYLQKEFKLSDLQPKPKVLWDRCEASVYGLNSSEGNTNSTANGQAFVPFDPVLGMSAAVKVADWKALKGESIEVTNLATKKKVTVLVVDNGGLPNSSNLEKCVDLQGYAAREIGIPGSEPGGIGSIIEVSVAIASAKLTDEQLLEKSITLITGSSIMRSDYKEEYVK